VRVHLTDNPKVFRTMGWGETIYRGEIHAKAAHDMGPPAEYTHDDLWYLRADFQGKWQVDNALRCLGDISLAAEVRRYCAAMEVVGKLEASIKRLEDDLFIHID
jgi:hypothetical protein